MKFFSNSNKKLQVPSRTVRRGFTLVEMIVALGIFSIVAVVALGALVKIISANKKAQTLQASITNLNFALESMSREMRVGTNYYCNAGTSFVGSSISSPDNCDILGTDVAYIAFISSESDPDPMDDCNLIYVYKFSVDPGNSNAFLLKKARQSSCGASISDGEYFPIVDPSVTITGYYLKVAYNASTDPYPLATVRVTGYAGAREKEKTYFDVQMAVSARLK